MINIRKGTDRFNFRSVAVIIQDNHVLLHRLSTDAFWSLPGGRVEFFEFAHEAVVREVHEETEIESRSIRPLWHVECFFRLHGKHFHEIATYFEVEPIQPVTSFEPFHGEEGDLILVFEWFPLDGLKDLNLKSAFLKEGLLNLPESPQYLCVKDD